MPAGPPELAALDGFSAATRAWFTGVFAAPTPAQAQAWAAIGKGEDTLVVAPTGSGKTLAAFLWALDKLATTPPPAEPAHRCRILYVSPLKALAVDIERNLRAPLAGIRQAATRLGVDMPEIRVGVRTGDTAADERRRLAAKPPDVLITTPESLFLLLTSRAREGLCGVETVIVDEVHAVAGNKRGAHLALSLERLDAFRTETEPHGDVASHPGRDGPGCGGPGHGGRGPAQRIGLSATVRPVEEVASFLGGARQVTVVRPPADKRFDLRIVVPVEDMTDPGPVGNVDDRLAGERDGPGGPAGPGGPGDLDTGTDDPRRPTSVWPHVEQRVLDIIERQRSTLVFANSRRLAERLCARLNELAADRAESDGAAPAGRQPPAEVMAQAGSTAGAPAEVARAHHGSVSRRERTDIEEALKRGALRAVVATSSLELGIDMGAVDLVIQVESPPSVASGLQRVGRAGHNVGDVSRGVIFPKYRGDLAPAAVVAQRIRTGEIEELRMPRNPLDVLAQQVVAMAAMDDWPVDRLAAVLRRAAPFAGLTSPVLEATLDMLAGRYPSEEFAGLRPRIVWDRVAAVIRGRPGAQRLAVTSGGTIPDRGLFTVLLAGAEAASSGGSRRTSRRVGELDEEMVYESRVGDVFVLGASSWRIEDITADSVLVSPAAGQPGKLPFWHGDAPGRPAELGAAIGAMCRSLSDSPPPKATATLRAAGLDELAAGNLLAYLAEQREAVGCVPDDRTLVVERFRDELGDWRVVLHSPYGARVHAPWALAIAAGLRERYGGMDVQAVHTDDGIMLRVPDTDEPPPAGIALVDPDEITDLVTAELGASAMLAARFRECASRALLLPRRQPGRRMPLWQQRQRAAQLLEVASHYPSFPIVLETVRECLQDVFDVPALVALLRDLAARRIRLVEVETATPSPFGASMLFRYVGAFMYEGDAPLAERRAQALSLDSALLAELLGQADLRELLDPEVVEATQRDLQRLSADRRCGDAEAVADLLAMLGPLSAAEVADRCAPADAAAGWLAELGRQRRAIEVRVAGGALWAAVEDAGRLRDALGVPVPPGIPAAFTEPFPDPLGDLVARYARTHGPFSAHAVAARYGLGVAVVTGALRRLAAAGTVVDGEFGPVDDGRTAGGPEAREAARWCDAGVLRLLRRRCLARLRKEAEPVPPVALARLLPAWQGVAPVGLSTAGSITHGGVGGVAAGADATFATVEQLTGVPIPASALETLVLPGRVAGYSPAMLDTLTAAGEVIWSGAGSLPGGDGWVVLATADVAPLLLPEPVAITTTPLHDAILAALADGGALFFRTLHDRVTVLLAAAAESGQPPSDAEVAAVLWDLLWAGHLGNDTLAPLRILLAGGSARHTGRAAPGSAGAPNRRRARVGSVGRPAAPGRPTLPTRTGPPTVGGRWSRLPAREDDPTRRAHALAQVLLDRHGVLTRGAVASERVPGGFAAVYPVLRAMEEAGRCRRGYFVEGLGAAQFALPGAVDRMRSLAPPAVPAPEPAAGVAAGPTPVPPDWTQDVGRSDRRHWTQPSDRPGDPRARLDPLHRSRRVPDRAPPTLVLAAADPANPYGAALPWPPRPDEAASSHRPGRKAGALVVLVDGDLVLYVERGGRTLLSWSEDAARLQPAAAALAGAVRAGALGRLTVERADGGGVYDSPLATALQSSGFRPTPRGLRLRG